MHDGVHFIRSLKSDSPIKYAQGQIAHGFFILSSKVKSESVRTTTESIKCLQRLAATSWDNEQVFKKAHLMTKNIMESTTYNMYSKGFKIFLCE